MCQPTLPPGGREAQEDSEVWDQPAPVGGLALTPSCRWLWVSDLISLGLSVLICKVEVVVISQRTVARLKRAKFVKVLYSLVRFGNMSCLAKGIAVRRASGPQYPVAEGTEFQDRFTTPWDSGHSTLGLSCVVPGALMASAWAQVCSAWSSGIQYLGLRSLVLGMPFVCSCPAPQPS